MIWKILGISKTSDKKEIKKAYHAKLKITHPEDDPEGFMKLRNAYEKALEQLEQNMFFEDEEDFEYEYEDESDDDFEDDFDEDDESEDEWQESEEEIKARHRNEEYGQWWKKMRSVLRDQKRRNNVKCWEEILYDDIPYQMQHYENCRREIKALIFSEENECYLPKEVWELLDKFFDFTVSERRITYNCETSQGERDVFINRKVRLNEIADFDYEIETQETSDQFFCFYERLLEAMEEEDESDIRFCMMDLDDMELSYLPYECIRTAYRFPKYSQEENKKNVEELVKEYGDCYEIRLLKAQFELYLKNVENAVEALKQLYMEVPSGKYPIVYQLSVCCEKAGLYYEAYMLVKQLTWLRPKKYMFEMAGRIYESMNRQFEEKLESGQDISDAERIRMCRMYLRSNREKEAVAILDEVKDVDTYSWEYHMANGLCSLLKEDTSQAEKEINILQGLDNVNEIDKLELREFQVRYLLECKEYTQCIKACNELLCEYPLSYPVKILRSFADYAMNGRDKIYADLEEIITLSPMRAEVLLLLASQNMQFGAYSDVISMLKPVKELCEAQYDYARIEKIGFSDFDDYVTKWKSFLKKAKKKEFYIPAISRYGLTSMRDIYEDGCTVIKNIFDSDAHRKYFNLMKDLEKSTVNHPEKYVNYAYLCRCAKKNTLAVKEYKKEIEKVNGILSPYEVQELRVDYISSLDKAEYAEILEEQMQHINVEWMSENKKRYYYHTIGAFYQNTTREFEKAVYYYEKSLAYANGVLEYLFLMETYYEWGVSTEDNSKYMKGLEIIEEAFRHCGRTGDVHGNTISLYQKQADLYVALGDEKHAVEAINNMKKYTKREQTRRSYPTVMTRVYEYLGNIEKAYEWHMKTETNSVTDANHKMMQGKFLMQLHRCKEAYDVFMEVQKQDDEAGCLDFDAYMCALDAEFFETKKHNKKMAEKGIKFINDHIEHPNADKNNFYAHLARLHRMAGDYDKAKYYRQLLEEIEWESQWDYTIMSSWVDVWNLWCDGEYEKIKEYIKAHRNGIYCIIVKTINLYVKEIDAAKKQGMHQ